MQSPPVDAPFHHSPHFPRWPLLWLVLLTIVLRSPGIDRPLLGNFATKNVVYAMIARNWVEGRASVWYPTLDVMAGGHRSLHLLEFPASAYFSGWLWSMMGGSLDLWGRVTAVGLISAAVMLLYRFVYGRHGRDAAAGAALVLAISPVSIVVGQSFMLEPSLVLFTVAAFFAQDRWLAGGRFIWLALACLSTALALLTKIYMLVWLIPLATDATGVLVYPRRATRQTDQIRREKAPGRQLAALAALGLAILPAAVWYWHVADMAAPGSPLADRVFYSVRQSATVHRPPHPLLTTPDFYRQVLDDLAGVVLTPVGFTLALAGLLHPARRRYAAWLGASGLLLAALPLKFYEMNYYWLSVLPALCVMAGLGWKRVSRRLRPRRTAVAVVLLVSLLFALRYAAKPAFVTPAEDLAVVPAAEAIQKLTDSDEPVVTMHGTTIDLLYYCDRPGWAVPPETHDLAAVLAEHRREAARWLVFVGPDSSVPRDLAHLPIHVRGSGYAVYDLDLLGSHSHSSFGGQP